VLTRALVLLALPLQTHRVLGASVTTMAATPGSRADAPSPAAVATPTSSAVASLSSLFAAAPIVKDNLLVVISFDVTNEAARAFVLGNPAAQQQQVTLKQALEDAGLTVSTSLDGAAPKRSTRGAVFLPVLTASYMQKATCMLELFFSLRHISDVLESNAPVGPHNRRPWVLPVYLADDRRSIPMPDTQQLSKLLPDAQFPANISKTIAALVNLPHLQLRAYSSSSRDWLVQQSVDAVVLHLSQDCCLESHWLAGWEHPYHSYAMDQLIPSLPEAALQILVDCASVMHKQPISKAMLLWRALWKQAALPGFRYLKHLGLASTDKHGLIDAPEGVRECVGFMLPDQEVLGIAGSRLYSCFNQPVGLIRVSTRSASRDLAPAPEWFYSSAHETVF